MARRGTFPAGFLLLVCLFMPSLLGANTSDRFLSPAEIEQLEQEQLLSELDAITQNTGADLELEATYNTVLLLESRDHFLDDSLLDSYKNILSIEKEPAFDELSEYEAIAAEHHRRRRSRAIIRSQTPGEAITAGGSAQAGTSPNERSTNLDVKTIGETSRLSNKINLTSGNSDSQSSIGELYYSIKQGYVRRSCSYVNIPFPFLSFFSLSIYAISDSRIASHAILNSIHQSFSKSSALHHGACTGPGNTLREKQ